MSTFSHIKLGTWLTLFGAWSVVVIFWLFAAPLLASPLTPLSALALFVLLFVTILAASFGVVHEADHLAEQLGEPYGTLILTLSIVGIEVILIASVLLGPSETPSIGRDSIFAVMMIILNLVMGLCLIAGAARHGAQEYNAPGTTAYLSMIALLTGVALLLPNYSGLAGEFSAGQALIVSALTVLLYGVFLGKQMGSQRRLFIQPPSGNMAVTPVDNNTAGSAQVLAKQALDLRSLVIHSSLLLALILPIVLLAHDLAVVTDYGIEAAGLPLAVGGVLIAIIVFTPESISAIKAARNNEMQRAINLCLGAFVSTVGLTVPVVLSIGLVSGKQVLMGISASETLLFALTLLLSMLSFNGQRTAALQGYMHIALFAVFVMLLFYP